MEREVLRLECLKLAVKFADAIHGGEGACYDRRDITNIADSWMRWIAKRED